jgi:nicotinamide-nucleotide amidase
VAGVVEPDEGRISFRASFPEVSMRIVVHGDPEEAQQRLQRASARVRERLGPYCYGEGSVTMEEVAGLALRARGLRVATAESCTGGLVGHRLTNVPGSSAWVMGGVVAYANEVKESLLGVRAGTLAEHGAVSAETAGEMAAGVRRVLGAELGLAVTGIAGPDGGTPEKPVGTVCFGLASEAGTVSARYQLWGTRDWVKLLASQVALDWLRRHALDLDMTESRVLRRR